LATFLGISVHAHTVVIATFMLGLALGSWRLGLEADRNPNPLRLFGLLEAGIGLTGLLNLALIPALQRIYPVIGGGLAAGIWQAQGLRLLMAAAALLLPTFLMGGTLPALVRGLGKDFSRLDRTVASLYGLNTLGAAMGAYGAGFVLLPLLGIRGTVVVAVTANLTIAAAFLLPRTEQGRDRELRPGHVGETSAGSRIPGSLRARLLTLFALSGFAALALQLAWIRALTQIIGSSVYAFSTVLATYLAGIALGSLTIPSLIGGARSSRVALSRIAVIELATGFSALVGLPVIGKLPEAFLAGYRAGITESFFVLQVFVFALAAAVMIVPTLLLGALFPLFTALIVEDRTRVGHGVGAAYAANSSGTILGTVIAGLLLLPTLGAEDTLRWTALLFATVAGALWMMRPRVRRRRSLLQALGVLGLFALIVSRLPPWDLAVMTSGPFINASRIVDVPAGRTFRDWIGQRNRIVFYGEGAEATVSVRDVGEERLLVINGKTDGSRHGDRKTQFSLAHLPLLMHSEPRKVLVIGLGTGMSAAAAATHNGVEQLDVVEISPRVVEAARYFRAESGDILLDPRLRLYQADARNLLLTRREEYDAILSEPSNPWITGIANLFTEEFFALAENRLAPDGLMAQWFQTYGMSATDLKSVLSTFRRVFPHVTVWSPQLGDLLFIGSREPHHLQLSRIETLLASPPARTQLEPIALASPVGFARLFLLGDRESASFARGALPNTDNHPRIEFNAPRNLYAETTLANMIAAVEHLDTRSQAVPFAGLDRYEPTTGLLTAFGLEIAADSAAEAKAEWQVTWTTAIPAEPGGLPRVGVGSRRVIHLDLANGHAELQLGITGASPRSQDLLDYLSSLTPGPATEIGRLSLNGGTRAIWSRGLSPDGARFAGLAWSCGEAEGGYSRYVALAEKPSQGVNVLLELARRIRCVESHGRRSGV
jgi:spermidine synthase